MLKISQFALVLSLCASTAWAQDDPERFSPRGDQLPDGSKPHVAFDLTRTLPNWEGTDGAGCCVMASGRNNAIHLGMPEVGETLKRVSSAAPGGHWHEKFMDQMSLVEQAHPGLKYWSDPAADWETLRQFNAKGLPIGVTMGTGARYNWQIIGHMVSAVHIGADDELSAYCDNNFPRELSAMPTPIFQRRAAIGNPTGKPWATILFPTRPPRPEPPGPAPGPYDPDDREPSAPIAPWSFLVACVAVSTWTWLIVSRFSR